ncbi:MAG: hypothetical protein V1773_14685 [bacterium]
MKKVIIMTIFILLGAASLILPQSSNEILNEGINTLIQADNNVELSQYLKARSLFERGLSIEPENNILKYYKAYCNYKICSIYSSKKGETVYIQYLDESISLLKEIIKNDESNSEAMALLATCYGIKISSDWSLAQSLGAESQKLLAMALQITPNNPRVLLQAGIPKLYTPEFFGGDKKAAVDFFKKSVESFKNGNDNSYRWGKMDAYAWLGIGLTALKDTTSAITVYNEALTIEPNYSWIKYKLLPSIQKSTYTNN